MTEKSIYRDLSQGKDWGSDLSLEESFSTYFSLKIFLENISLEGKRRIDPELIYQIGNPTLGALIYLHVGFQLKGI